MQDLSSYGDDKSDHWTPPLKKSWTRPCTTCEYLSIFMNTWNIIIFIFFISVAFWGGGGIQKRTSFGNVTAQLDSMFLTKVCALVLLFFKIYRSRKLME